MCCFGPFLAFSNLSNFERNRKKTEKKFKKIQKISEKFKKAKKSKKSKSRPNAIGNDDFHVMIFLGNETVMTVQPFSILKLIVYIEG